MSFALWWNIGFSCILCILKTLFPKSGALVATLMFPLPVRHVTSLLRIMNSSSTTKGELVKILKCKIARASVCKEKCT